jgi:hypothetical protein
MRDGHARRGSQAAIAGKMCRIVRRLASLFQASGECAGEAKALEGPKSLGAAESPYSIAARGDRHSGFLREALEMTRRQLEKTARSLQKKIEEHEGFLENPSSHVDNWFSLRPSHQASLIEHWDREIADWIQQQQIAGYLLMR